MKLSELEMGKIYKCNLSGLKTLVFKNPEKQMDAEDNIIQDDRVFGKCAQRIELNESIKTEYFVNEIFDGQLSKI